jgi:hypothetical protein
VIKIKFIHCFNNDLKNKLLQSGFNLISEFNNISIFENNSKLTFSFNKIDKKQFILSNQLFL